MRRRDFFSFIGGAMLAVPGFARAQPGGRIPTVGYLWHAGNAKEETHISKRCSKASRSSATSRGATSSLNIASRMKRPSVSRAWPLSLYR
jgi:hypothetical protein